MEGDDKNKSLDLILPKQHLWVAKPHTTGRAQIANDMSLFPNHPAASGETLISDNKTSDLC